ncbi:hypothetical protein NPIL_611691 [Nephila pilipes]|uniref:Peptidase S1 domain-containing protein n=1 Tax=Nephila pilipes TaxID=299642 RepID=A0A8X6QS16_NEPPI|nr:hypothetical protein NPIL_611691 [Nephila pilipes]
MHFGGLQCCISIFVFLNLHVIAKGQDEGNNFPTTEGPTSEKDDIDNEDCMKCGLDVIDREGKIVNGEEVTPLNKYPWIVPLNVGNLTICGGALISRTFILTAAHCIFNTRDMYPICLPTKERNVQRDQTLRCRMGGWSHGVMGDSGSSAFIKFRTDSTLSEGHRIY